MAFGHLQLVASLRHAGLSTRKPRNRFTLWAIAFECDGPALCRASFARLARMTGLHADVISGAVEELVADGLVTLEAGMAGPQIIRLSVARLQEMQEMPHLRAQDSVRQLAAYGVTERALCALERDPDRAYVTVSDLMAAYVSYCQLPEHHRTGFHRHLTVRGLGMEGGRQLVEALRRVQAPERGTSPS